MSYELLMKRIAMLRSVLAGMESSKLLCIKDAEVLYALGCVSDAQERIERAARYTWGYWRPDAWYAI